MNQCIAILELSEVGSGRTVLLRHAFEMASPPARTMVFLWTKDDDESVFNAVPGLVQFQVSKGRYVLHFTEVVIGQEKALNRAKELRRAGFDFAGVQFNPEFETDIPDAFKELADAQ